MSWARLHGASSSAAARPTSGAQGLTYGAGITGATTGARGLCLTVAELPPGAHSRAHLHRRIESGGYVVEGTVETLWGERLEHAVVAREGEFVYIPPDVPHLVRNPSDGRAGAGARRAHGRRTTSRASSCGPTSTSSFASLGPCPPARDSPVWITSSSPSPTGSARTASMPRCWAPSSSRAAEAGRTGSASSS